MNNGAAVPGVYVRAAIEAAAGLKRNWRIVFGSAALVVVFGVVRQIFGGLGFAGGMIVGMAQVALLSLHYSWLSATVERDKLSWRSLLEFNYPMFFTVISVAFVFFIIDFAAQSLLQGLDPTLLLFLGLGLAVVFNPIPEVIIVERIESMPALGRAADFMKSCALEWLLPLVVILLPALLLSYEGVVVALARIDPLSPTLIVPLAVDALFAHIPVNLSAAAMPAGILAANWFALFRINLFKHLSRRF